MRFIFFLITLGEIYLILVINVYQLWNYIFKSYWLIIAASYFLIGLEKKITLEYIWLGFKAKLP